MLLLLLLLSRFSRARLCATPQMAAHQAPPSLGFSRQEYWSGVPLLSLKTNNEGKIKVNIKPRFVYKQIIQLREEFGKNKEVTGRGRADLILASLMPSSF